jgi:hypothetical protein
MCGLAIKNIFTVATKRRREEGYYFMKQSGHNATPPNPNISPRKEKK